MFGFLKNIMSNNESFLTGDNSVHRILKTDIHKDPNQQDLLKYTWSKLVKYQKQIGSIAPSLFSF